MKRLTTILTILLMMCLIIGCGKSKVELAEESALPVTSEAESTEATTEAATGATTEEITETTEPMEIEAVTEEITSEDEEGVPESTEPSTTNPPAIGVPSGGNANSGGETDEEFG